MDWPKGKRLSIPAKPAGLWTAVEDYVKGPLLIKIEADPAAEWSYSVADRCSADGDLVSMMPSQRCLVTTAPVGALVCKIGGSTAGATDGALFAAGHFCVIEIPADTSGPLYLGINDETTGMDNNSGVIEVTVTLKPLPPPEAAQAK